MTKEKEMMCANIVKKAINITKNEKPNVDTKKELIDYVKALRVHKEEK